MDTIAAIAAGGGAPSAIGVVRISGPDCFAACGRVFRSARPFGELEARRMVLGEFLDRRPCSPLGQGRRGRGSSRSGPF